MPAMLLKRSGMQYYVVGEFCTAADPSAEDTQWEVFENDCLLPDEKPFFTVWSQLSKIDRKERDELDATARTIVEWLVSQQDDWRGIHADLWHYRGNDKHDRKVATYNLA